MEGLTLREVLYVGQGAALSVEDHRAPERCPRVRVLPGGLVARGFKGNSRAPVGGVRGEVTHFSSASRRRLRVKLMSLDWDACDFTFLSLTFHNVWPTNAPDLKAALYRFMARVEYHFPAVRGWVWRLEAQRRGAPHYHAVVCWQKGRRVDAVAVRRELKRHWTAAIGTTEDRASWLYGCDVVDGHTSKGPAVLIGYLVKEMGKVTQAADGHHWGRLWGLRGDVPLVPGEVVQLTEDQWQDFCKHIGRLPQARRSWYLGAINENWAGFVLVLDPGIAARLLAGFGAPRPGLPAVLPAWGESGSGGAPCH